VFFSREYSPACWPLFFFYMLMANRNILMRFEHKKKRERIAGPWRQSLCSNSIPGSRIGAQRLRSHSLRELGTLEHRNVRTQMIVILLTVVFPYPFITFLKKRKTKEAIYKKERKNKDRLIVFLPFSLKNVI